MAGSIPIIRLELEQMKHSILAAFSQYELQLDEDVRAAVAAYFEPENIKRVLAEQVKRTLDKVIADEVETFYRYGNGRKAVREVLREILEAGEQADREQEAAGGG